jgi:hypothetical protein
VAANEDGNIGQDAASRRPFRQQLREGLFPLFGCLGHTFKKEMIERSTGTDLQAQ